MYVAALLLSVLSFLLSSLAGLCIPLFLTNTDSGGDNGIAYALGVLVSVVAVVPGLTASGLLFAARSQEQHQRRLLVRRFWLPLCAPALALVGLHVMLLWE